MSFEFQSMSYIKRSTRKRKQSAIMEPSHAASVRRRATESRPSRPSPAQPTVRDSYGLFVTQSQELTPTCTTSSMPSQFFASLGAGFSALQPPITPQAGNDSVTITDSQFLSSSLTPATVTPINDCTVSFAPQISTPSTCIPLGSPQPMTSINNDVAATVPQNIKEKIMKGQYIDLATLLSNDHNPNVQKLVLFSSAIHWTKVPYYSSKFTFCH